MTDSRTPDLSFPSIPTGTHGVQWDLRMLLFYGGASTNRRVVAKKIEQGELGAPIIDRLPLIVRIHSVVDARLISGDAFRTVHGVLSCIRRFVAWTEGNGYTLSLDTVRSAFQAWVDHLVWRDTVQKDLKRNSAYHMALQVAPTIAKILGYEGAEPARVLMRQTRMISPGRRKGKPALGIASDKKNLSDTFAFGHLITDLCCAMTTDTMRGSLPVSVVLRDGRSLQIKGKLKSPNLDLETIRRACARERFKRSRAPLPADVNVIDARPSLVNLRIEAELVLFIAQTGMNLTQAAQLRREQYRWQTAGDEISAFKVYKGRRHGEAIFRCFKVYRAHFFRYLDWLEEVGLSSSDNRVFPILHHKGVIPAGHHFPTFRAIEQVCKQAGVGYICSRALRKTRINWLLRHSKNLDLTATLAAHRKSTLVRSYEEPDRRGASIEILSFHQQMDPTASPPGPGICIRTNGSPNLEESASPEAPLPDCISPDGCLFCTHHRDVMSADYCLKLASHSRLKTLEALLTKPSKKTGLQPAYVVVDRIEAKLNAIAKGSQVRAVWVRDAKDQVRSGIYHPLWDTQIQLLEALSEQA